MRSHPVVGTFLLLVAVGLFLVGALASSAPGPLGDLPVPPEVVVPFLMWQLALWCGLFGFFFIRPRGRVAAARARAVPRF